MFGPSDMVTPDQVSQENKAPFSSPALLAVMTRMLKVKKNMVSLEQQRSKSFASTYMSTNVLFPHILLNELEIFVCHFTTMANWRSRFFLNLQWYFFLPSPFLLALYIFICSYSICFSTFSTFVRERSFHSHSRAPAEPHMGHDIVRQRARADRSESLLFLSLPTIFFSCKIYLWNHVICSCFCILHLTNPFGFSVQFWYAFVFSYLVL